MEHAEGAQPVNERAVIDLDILEEILFVGGVAMPEDAVGAVDHGAVAHDQSVCGAVAKINHAAVAEVVGRDLTHVGKDGVGEFEQTGAAVGANHDLAAVVENAAVHHQGFTGSARAQQLSAHAKERIRHAGVYVGPHAVEIDVVQIAVMRGIEQTGAQRSVGLRPCGDAGQRAVALSRFQRQRKTDVLNITLRVVGCAALQNIDGIRAFPVRQRVAFDEHVDEIGVWIQHFFGEKRSRERHQQT
ncbi:MAG: hypothetical protein BWY83_02608 [bacterium ADurb.Bin478]|nr:MAG: hypothetical protein BWY83_02608 [bacterium ADurb.Bin478]